MKKFLFFEVLIMPYVVKILFWLIEIVLLIVSLYFIFFEKMGKFPERLLVGLLGFSVITIIVRLFLETWLVIFGIYEQLRKTKEMLK
ncbi:DUF4282 domain-containing protein [Raineya sp.]|jgi:hypothetical protein